MSPMYSAVASSTGIVAPVNASRTTRSAVSSHTLAVPSRPPAMMTFSRGTERRSSCSRTRLTSRPSGSMTMCRVSGRVAAT